MTTLTYILIVASLFIVIHALFWHDWACKEPMNGEEETLKAIEKLFRV